MVRFKDGSTVGEPTLLKADAGAYTPLGVSSDGSFFYGLSHQSSDIYSVEVDPRTLQAQGAPTVAVTSYPGRNMWPAWSPSGDALAYYSNRESEEESRMVVHRSGGHETVVSKPFLAFTVSSQWCSDNLIAKERQRFDAHTGAVLPAQRPQGLHAPFQDAPSPDCRLV
jgi:hypothetical protein